MTARQCRGPYRACQTLESYGRIPISNNKGDNAHEVRECNELGSLLAEEWDWRRCVRSKSMHLLTKSSLLVNQTCLDVSTRSPRAILQTHSPPEKFLEAIPLLVKQRIIRCSGGIHKKLKWGAIVALMKTKRCTKHRICFAK